MAPANILADAYDRIKHIELTLAHGLPLRDVLTQIAALRTLLLPFRRDDAAAMFDAIWLQPT